MSILGNCSLLECVNRAVALYRVTCCCVVISVWTVWLVFNLKYSLLLLSTISIWYMYILLKFYHVINICFLKFVLFELNQYHLDKTSFEILLFPWWTFWCVHRIFFIQYFKCVHKILRSLHRHLLLIRSCYLFGDFFTIMHLS